MVNKEIRARAEAMNMVIQEPEKRNELPYLVILFGWTGSAHRYIGKYAEDYLAQGYTVIQHAPLKTNFLPVQNAKRGKKVLEILESVALVMKADYGRYPMVIIHSFSNGGLMPLLPILQDLGSKSRSTFRDHISGIIMDSCPAEFTWRGGLAAFFFSHKDRPFIIAWTIWILLFLMFYSTSFVASIVPPFGVANHYKLPLLWTAKWIKRVEFLYLYSKTDVLTRYKYVEQVIEDQKKHKMVVHSKRWDDSEHVRHLQYHRDEYLQACREFISRLTHFSHE